MDVRQACVHFLQKPDEKRAIAVANSAKFGNTRIKVEPCKCKDSFSGMNGSKPAGNITQAAKTPTYRSKDPVAVEILATVFRADESTEEMREAAITINHENPRSRKKHDVSARSPLPQGHVRALHPRNASHRLTKLLKFTV